MPSTGKLPIIGPWISKIGRLENIIATPCHITPQVFATSFFAAVPQLVWTLYKPDPIDNYLELFGPPGRPGLRPFGRGGLPHRRRRFRVGGIIQPENPISGKFGTAVWRLGSLAQRIGWYFLIVDAGINHAINWMSLAYEWSGCQLPGGALEGSYDPGTVLLPSDNWQTLSNWNWQGSAPPIGVGPAGAFIPGNLPWSQTCSITSGPPSHGIGPYGGITASRIINTLNPDPDYTYGQDAEPTVVGQHSKAVMVNMPSNSGGSKNLRVQVKVSGGYCSITSSNWQITAGASVGINPDP